MFSAGHPPESAPGCKLLKRCKSCKHLTTLFSGLITLAVTRTRATLTLSLTSERRMRREEGFTHMMCRCNCSVEGKEDGRSRVRLGFGAGGVEGEDVVPGEQLVRHCALHSLIEA